MLKDKKVAGLENNAFLKAQKVAGLENVAFLKDQKIAWLESDILLKDEEIALLKQDISLKYDIINRAEYALVPKHERLLPLKGNIRELKFEERPTRDIQLKVAKA